MAAAKLTKRPTADRRNRDAEVVEAAIRIFHAKGYSAATIQDVADAVGVLKGSLYHYISSKEDLLFRILTESHEQARGIKREVLAMDAPPVARLQEYLEQMYLWYTGHVERACVYLSEQHHLTGERAVEMRAQAREFEHFLRELLAEAKGAGSLRADLDVRLAAYFILGVLNSIPRWYRPGGSLTADALAREFTEMSLRALTTGTWPPRQTTFVDDVVIPPGAASLAHASRARRKAKNDQDEPSSE